MARKPLRSQLNQIRAWVREGRTHAWIAHQLDLSASELRDFIRRHDLEADSDGADDSDLRDEIEAEIEASMEAEPDDDSDSDDEDEEEDSDSDDSDEDSDDASGDEGPRDGDSRPRRRRRRRRPKRAGAGLEASFDHGDTDGFGLWLDPAVAEDPVYVEHWKGHRPVEVTVEADRIVIRRSGQDS